MLNVKQLKKDLLHYVFPTLSIISPVLMTQSSLYPRQYIGFKYTPLLLYILSICIFVNIIRLSVTGRNGCIYSGIKIVICCLTGEQQTIRAVVVILLRIK